MWLVLLHLSWAGAAFAVEGFHTGGRHLNYQTLLMDAEEAVKEDRVEDEKWRADQAALKANKIQDPDEDRLAARAKKANALRQKQRGEQLQQERIKDHEPEDVELKQKKHPGLQALLKDAEEAEKEDREADEQWEEEDPEADMNWQRAHALFEKINQGHAQSVDKRQDHKEIPGYESHFLKWSKRHPGFQHLLKDELETESEEREAEHEAVIEEQDDAKMVHHKTDHDTQQTASQKTSTPEPSSKEDRQLQNSGQPSTKEDTQLQKLMENEKLLTHEIEDEQKLVHAKLNDKQHEENPHFETVLKDENKLIDKLKHEAKLVHGKMHHQHHGHHGFQTLLRDEELALQRKNEARSKPEFQPSPPGFQTLLKGEENWVRDRKGELGSEFLRHRSQKVAKAKYRPLDDMPDTGSYFRSIPNKQWGGKGSFWHSMGRRNEVAVDAEDQDAQRMEEAAEHQTEAAEHQTEVAERNPEDLHDTSRSFGAHLVREVGSMSGWGQVKEDPDKPQMDMIEQMRAEYCSKRPDGPMNHKDCSKWMFDACKKESSGAGWCKQFKEELTDYCGKHPGHKYCEGVKDTDGDGILDDIDVFPEDGKEWKDSDGDGVGNNADAFDDDPEKHEPEGGAPAAAAPAPAVSGPAASPAVAGEWPGSSNKKAEGVPYPEQGYNEYHRGNLAAHNDKQTWVGDWGGEWPLMDETHRESIDKACKDEPDNDWCQRQARVTNPSYPKGKGLFDWLFR